MSTTNSLHYSQQQHHDDGEFTKREQEPSVSLDDHTTKPETRKPKKNKNKSNRNSNKSTSSATPSTPQHETQADDDDARILARTTTTKELATKTKKSSKKKKKKKTEDASAAATTTATTNDDNNAGGNVKDGEEKPRKKKSKKKNEDDVDEINVDKKKKKKKKKKSKKTKKNVVSNKDQDMNADENDNNKDHTDWITSLKEEEPSILNRQQPRRYSFHGSIKYGEQIDASSKSSVMSMDGANEFYGYEQQQLEPTGPLRSEQSQPFTRQHQQQQRRRSSLQRSTSIRRMSLKHLFQRNSSSSSGAPNTMSRRRHSNSRRRAFEQHGRTDNFRITSNPRSMQLHHTEAYFYNHGMELALSVLFVALQILAGCHGAYQFTALGGFVTDDPILRWTLPIARAGGRLVTLNCAILLLTACKYTWTMIRTYIAPIVPIGFPIDNIMPKYHRTVALWIIVMGILVHTLPQVINYATKSIVLEQQFRFWTYGDGFATTQLLITGTVLVMIFSTFFITTLPAFRKTAAGFRWFWFFHMGGIATAYPLLLLHGTCKGQPIFFYVALFPLVLYLFDVAMRRRGLSTTKVLAWKTHEDNGEHITELVIEKPKNFTYTPGQYAELKFTPISTREWHPFTIASAPSSSEEQQVDRTEHSNFVSFSNHPINDDDDDDDDIESGVVVSGGNPSSSKEASSYASSDENGKLVFYIKSTGRWTEALYNYASAFDLTKATKDCTIQIRGPHGAPAMNYFEYRHIIVIGSGIGVTPLMSIWKYLVNRATSMYHQRRINNSNHSAMKGKPIRNDSNLTIATSTSTDNSSRYGDDPLSARFNDEEEDDELFQQQEHKKETKIHKFAILVEKILESMTVSMIVLCLFVMGETFGVVLQLFGFELWASTLGSILAFLALIIHGSNLIVSTIVLGIVQYIVLVKFWLELAIVVVDSATLWLGLMALTGHSNARNMNTMSFTFFGIVVVLHALRIFHIFYITLKPPKAESTTLSNDLDSVSSKSNNEIHSIQGILINKHFSGMRFAARSLMPPIEDGLSKLFSMEFYGTREKPKNADHDEKALIKSMMGSGHIHTERDSHQIVKQNPDDYFQTGRPNWKQIFLKAMAKAHATNPQGEAVGVFFCGSPAIAHDLQCMAKEVTAQHQFSRKHLDGTTCKCKLIVHSENF